MPGGFLRRRSLVTSIGLVLALPCPARAAPAETLDALFADLRRCLSGSRGTDGSDLTIVFSLRRNGSLIGTPRISHAELPGNRAEQQQFLASVASAFARCLPLDITDGLGGAIAGRPMRFRIVLGRRSA